MPGEREAGDIGGERGQDQGPDGPDREERDPAPERGSPILLVPYGPDESVEEEERETPRLKKLIVITNPYGPTARSLSAWVTGL